MLPACGVLFRKRCVFCPGIRDAGNSWYVVQQETSRPGVGLVSSQKARGTTSFRPRISRPWKGLYREYLLVPLEECVQDARDRNLRALMASRSGKDPVCRDVLLVMVLEVLSVTRHVLLQSWSLHGAGGVLRPGTVGPGGDGVSWN